MVIIQLAVPSAPGTNAGHSISRNKPAQQNLRVSTRPRKFFSWDEHFLATQKTSSTTKMARWKYWIREWIEKFVCKKSGEKAADQHRFGHTADRQHISAG